MATKHQCLLPELDIQRRNHWDYQYEYQRQYQKLTHDNASARLKSWNLEYWKQQQRLTDMTRFIPLSDQFVSDLLHVAAVVDRELEAIKLGSQFKLWCEVNHADNVVLVSARLCHDVFWSYLVEHLEEPEVDRILTSTFVCPAIDHYCRFITRCWYYDLQKDRSPEVYLLYDTSKGYFGESVTLTGEKLVTSDYFQSIRNLCEWAYELYDTPAIYNLCVS